MTIPDKALALRSLIHAEGRLELSLAEVDVPAVASDEVLVEVGASPINPSDLGPLFGPADMSTARAAGTPERPLVIADVPDSGMRRAAARLGKPLPIGNEAAGKVVRAGGSEAAQALLGKTVSIIGGGMYAQYRAVKVSRCLPLPEGTSAKEGASWFVNPLTCQGMAETMRREGHSALVHTAAASNLGQMLNKMCIADGIELVNIVRREQQEETLRALGAKHVVNSSKDSFMEDLITALIETQATLAFDAVGGGELASRILTAMEAAAGKLGGASVGYGTTTHKQVYIYGGLDSSPTVLTRGYGMAWGIGGWVLPSFLQRIDPETTAKLHQRVARELKTTFASHYTQEISLAEALQLPTIAAYRKQATGEKYLIVPNKDAEAAS